MAAGDPLPGEPGVIDAQARQLLGLAEALSDQGDALAGVVPDRVWVGYAAESFAQLRDRLPGTLEAVASRCGSGADVLSRWSQEVVDHQERGRLARDRAREGEEEIAAAAAGVQVQDRFVVEARRAAARQPAADDGTVVTPEVWTGPDWAALLVQARARRERAQAEFDEVVVSYQDAARRATDGLASASEMLSNRGPAAERWGNVPGGGGPLEFLVTDQGLMLNTAEAWRWETYRRAGIDPSSWLPHRGLLANEATVVAAWEFYNDLYRLDPDRFQWAGLANQAGGVLFGGFQDLHVMRQALEAGELTADAFAELLRTNLPGMPGRFYEQVYDAVGDGAGAVASDLRFVEQTFLRMQRDIFDDLAWQHLAFDAGGLPAMRALYDTGEIEEVHIDAWEQIASEDPATVRDGNTLLARHEQRNIIREDYDNIRNHSPLTNTLTVAMSYVAPSPVPGGTSFSDSVPYQVGVSRQVPSVRLEVPERLPVPGPVSVPLPGAGTGFDTPQVDFDVTFAELPLHDVSIDERRWEWVTRDILPDYDRLLDSGDADQVIGRPIRDRGAEHRTIPDTILPYPSSE